MTTNGYGTHRLHQVAIEWTPEWEAAYQQLIERRRNFIATAEKQTRRSGAFLLVVLTLALASLNWLDNPWVTGLLIFGAAVTALVYGQWSSKARGGDPEVERTYARLWLLRDLTHDQGEMARNTETMEKPVWDDRSFDGPDLASVRDDLGRLGIRISTRSKENA
jgi:hypothetical protein